MRFPLVVALIGLVVASTWAVADDKPIPQDPARMARFSDDCLAWNRATLGDAYAKVGKRDPKWDGPAREALDRAARLFSMREDPLVTPGDVFGPARQAVLAGCDDPLVLYLYAITGVGPNFPGERESALRVRRAGDAMAAGAYSPFRRAMAVLKATGLRVRSALQGGLSDDRRAIDAGFDQVLTLLARSAADDARGLSWETRWHEALWDILVDWYRLDGDRKPGFDRLDARLAQIPRIEPLRLSIRGQFYMQWAWDARTDRAAAAVTGKQFAAFGERLAEARRALEAAYKLDPKQPRVARTMLEVHKGIGAADDRATMELWFERAMELDPSDRDSCWNKLDWLDPRWHGDPDGREMLGFGRSCAATHNWHRGITLLAADALMRKYASNPRADGGKYLTRAENWELIRSVNEEYLKHYPDDAVALTKYAFLTFWAARIELAHELFERLGDRLTTWNDTPTVPIESIRRTREIAAKYVADLKAGKQPTPPK